jgi:RNA polymerase sigma factor for flagellar operon FliA
MHRVLTIEETWAEFMKTRDPRLRAELITAYLPLVRIIVHRLGIPETSQLETDDLISYGVIGLINAIDRFDATRGVCFETFACQRIRGAVIDQLRSLSWVPRSVLTRVRQIEGVTAALEQQLGRSASGAEIANALGISLEQYWQTMQDISTTVYSLETPPGTMAHEEDQISLVDMLEDCATPEPEHWLERRELMELLQTELLRLPERERLLLAWYYWEKQTMREISRRLAVSESRVCQLHAQAVTRLRALLNSANTVHKPEQDAAVPQPVPTAVKAGRR